jgi:Tfp pilus assembly protein FimT
MRRGATVAELVVVIVLVSVLLALARPRLAGWLDRVAVEHAARETRLALSQARQVAIAWGVRTRVVIRADGVWIDTLGAAWGTWRGLPGPADRGVALSVTNPEVRYRPNGIAWGLANTRIVLRRGGHSATITVSRVGRVKQW